MAVRDGAWTAAPPNPSTGIEQSRSRRLSRGTSLIMACLNPECGVSSAASAGTLSAGRWPLSTISGSTPRRSRDTRLHEGQREQAVVPAGDDARRQVRPGGERPRVLERPARLRALAAREEVLDDGLGHVVEERLAHVERRVGVAALGDRRLARRRVLPRRRTTTCPACRPARGSSGRRGPSARRPAARPRWGRRTRPSTARRARWRRRRRPPRRSRRRTRPARRRRRARAGRAR